MTAAGDFDLMAGIEDRRTRVAGDLDKSSRAKLGQVFTPSGVARFIASMVGEFSAGSSVRLLDPGAGVGSLAAAAVERLVRRDGVKRIEVVAIEVDSALRDPLRDSLGETKRWARVHGCEMSYEVRAESYLDVGTLESAEVVRDLVEL